MSTFLGCRHGFVDKGFSLGFSLGLVNIFLINRYITLLIKFYFINKTNY